MKLADVNEKTNVCSNASIHPQREKKLDNFQKLDNITILLVDTNHFIY